MKRGVFYMMLMFALVWMSCERDARIDLPQADPTIALTCFLSPGAPIQVSIQRVQPLFSDNGTPKQTAILDASVFFSNGSDTVQLSLKSGEEFYIDNSATMDIVAGSAYYIWASAPLLPSVWSSCTVPENYIDSFLINYTGATGADIRLQLSMDWQDIPGEDNYYRVFAKYEDSLIGGGYQGNEFEFITRYYSDVGRDGQFIQTGIGSYPSTGNQVTSRWINASLITCDINYFRYHLSIEEAVSGGPFIQQASLFSNVSGGVGCFGAYMPHTYKTKVF